MEFNEKIPVPIFFSMNYARKWPWKGDHMYGVSFAYATCSLAEFGYRPIYVEYNNIIFVDITTNCEILRDLEYRDQEVYYTGYWNRPERKQKFRWNEDVAPWYEQAKADPIKTMRVIQDFFMTTNTFSAPGQETTFFFGIDPYIDKNIYTSYKYNANSATPDTPV